MDTQQKEIIGRHILTNSLISAGIEVALPIRDNGVDLIAYSNPKENGTVKTALIQLKASSKEAFACHQKYEEISNLKIVNVWNIMTPDMVRIFCTTYQQQREMCLSYSFSTNSNGQIHWNTPKASAELKDKLMPYEAHTQTWPHLLFGS